MHVHFDSISTNLTPQPAHHLSPAGLAQSSALLLSHLFTFCLHPGLAFCRPFVGRLFCSGPGSLPANPQTHSSSFSTNFFSCLGQPVVRLMRAFQCNTQTQPSTRLASPPYCAFCQPLPAANRPPFSAGPFLPALCIGGARFSLDPSIFCCRHSRPVPQSNLSRLAAEKAKKRGQPGESNSSTSKTPTGHSAFTSGQPPSSHHICAVCCICFMWPSSRECGPSNVAGRTQHLREKKFGQTKQSSGLARSPPDLLDWLRPFRPQQLLTVGFSWLLPSRRPLCLGHRPMALSIVRRQANGKREDAFPFRTASGRGSCQHM